MVVDRWEWKLVESDSFYGYHVQVEDEQGTIYIKQSKQYVVEHRRARRNAIQACNRLLKTVEKLQ